MKPDQRGGLGVPCRELVSGRVRIEGRQVVVASVHNHGGRRETKSSSECPPRARPLRRLADARHTCPVAAHRRVRAAPPCSSAISSVCTVRRCDAPTSSLPSSTRPYAPSSAAVPLRNVRRHGRRAQTPAATGPCAPAGCMTASWPLAKARRATHAVAAHRSVRPSPSTLGALALCSFPARHPLAERLLLRRQGLRKTGSPRRPELVEPSARPSCP